MDHEKVCNHTMTQRTAFGRKCSSCGDSVDSEPYRKGYEHGKRNGSLEWNRGKPAPGAVSVPSEYLSNTPRGKAWDGWSYEAHDYATGYQDGWTAANTEEI